MRSPEDITVISDVNLIVQNNEQKTVYQCREQLVHTLQCVIMVGYSMNVQFNVCTNSPLMALM